MRILGKWVLLILSLLLKYDKYRERVYAFFWYNSYQLYLVLNQPIGVREDSMEKEIVEFLIKAKRLTYAGKGAETTSSREKSHDLIYKDGDYMYYDTYLGTGKFAGEEALWIQGNPYWSMNYIGRVTGENFSGDFLKESLLLVPEDKPFRGPENHFNGDYSYHCEIDGDHEWFQGRETITYKGSEIYECVFHGGLVE